MALLTQNHHMLPVPSSMSVTAVPFKADSTGKRRVDAVVASHRIQYHANSALEKTSVPVRIISSDSQ